MIYMNDYDIDRAYDVARDASATNLLGAITVLCRLVEWTDNNSDGWPYWNKPRASAQKLMALIEAKTACPWEGIVDPAEAEVKRAITPIKSFLTRQGQDAVEILFGP